MDRHTATPSSAYSHAARNHTSGYAITQPRSPLRPHEQEYRPMTQSPATRINNWRANIPSNAPPVSPWSSPMSTMSLLQPPPTRQQVTFKLHYLLDPRLESDFRFNLGEWQFNPTWKHVHDPLPLKEPATSPPTSVLSVRVYTGHKLDPWMIQVHASTVGDVLFQIYNFLQQPLPREDLDRFSPDDKYRVDWAEQKRCGFNNGRGTERGKLRVDLIGGLAWFRGLRKNGSYFELEIHSP